MGRAQDQERNTGAWDELTREWSERCSEATRAVRRDGIEALRRDPDYYRRKVRQNLEPRYSCDPWPTPERIIECLAEIIRLEEARIARGHHTADFNRLMAAQQLKAATHLQIAAAARARGAH